MGIFKPNVNKMESEQDIDGLVKALGNEKDVIVQLSAKAALQRFGSQAVGPLIKALKDKQEFLRWQAALALGDIKDTQAVDALIEALQDPAEIVRKCAAAALAKIGDLRAVKPLKKILENEKPTGKYDLHYEATVALQKIKDAVPKPIKNEEKKITIEKCDFCLEQVYVRQPGLTITTMMGDPLFDELKKASKRKFICPSCSSIFCLECGNKKGEELRTGSTHCPKCGVKVL